VIHLGDYIYEYKNGDYGWGNSIGRIPRPDREIYTLYDYRKRLATYRTDLDLLLIHQTFPWIPVWDDHGKFELAISMETWLTPPQRLQTIHGELVHLSSTTLKTHSSMMAEFLWTNGK
jgi:hypothetical protein